MTHARPLLPHPSTPVPDARAVSVTAGVTADGDLDLTYDLAFRPGSIRLPAPASGERVDGLWRHTCCEAFIGVPGVAGYREFNLSPSGDWQAYVFAGYRRGGPLEPARGPRLDCRLTATGCTLRARLPAADLPATGPWRLGLGAVLEDRDGGLSYWALGHPPGAPDFHHPDTFTLELAPP